MEKEREKQRPPHGQLISVPPRDTARLLEMYVKRSLSLNDGTHELKAAGRKEKWVTMPKKQRRHSSDPFLHLAPSVEHSDDGEIDTFAPVKPVPKPEKCPEESEKPTKISKKTKKTSFWKNIFGFFTRKSNEDKDDEQDASSDKSSASDAAITCLPVTPVTLPKKPPRRKSLKRRFSKKSLSFIKSNRPVDITGVEAVISVAPTDSYYEKVSEELEKIVHEVKEKEEVVSLSDEEIINRIIALTKEQGDAIELKLKDNPTLSNFFQQLTYSSFQKLADAYVEKEASPAQKPPTVLPTAPELVKLAFTLDFTARIAGLSKQNTGHITGLGNRYLQDRFEYRQVCTDHPWSDSDD